MRLLGPSPGYGALAWVERALDSCTRILDRLREHFAADEPVWAALTQGDPTDVNLAHPLAWLDYDTAGMSSLLGEFANFLWYTTALGGWLAPTYNPDAFADHPATNTHLAANRPKLYWAAVDTRTRTIHIDYNSTSAPARQAAAALYWQNLVEPTAADLWPDQDLGVLLRPYLAMRILAVYNLADLSPHDRAIRSPPRPPCPPRRATLRRGSSPGPPSSPLASPGHRQRRHQHYAPSPGDRRDHLPAHRTPTHRRQRHLHGVASPQHRARQRASRLSALLSDLARAAPDPPRGLLRGRRDSPGTPPARRRRGNFTGPDSMQGRRTTRLPRDLPRCLHTAPGRPRSLRVRCQPALGIRRTTPLVAV